MMMVMMMMVMVMMMMARDDPPTSPRTYSRPATGLLLKLLGKLLAAEPCLPKGTLKPPNGPASVPEPARPSRCQAAWLLIRHGRQQ